MKSDLRQQYPSQPRHRRISAAKPRRRATRPAAGRGAFRKRSFASGTRCRWCRNELFGRCACAPAQPPFCFGVFLVGGVAMGNVKYGFRIDGTSRLSPPPAISPPRAHRTSPLRITVRRNPRQRYSHRRRARCGNRAHGAAQSRPQRLFRRDARPHELVARRVQPRETSLTTPADAYKYFKGEPIKHPLGYDVKIDTPLDWAGVTDHSEYAGVVQLANDPSSPVSKTPGCAAADPEGKDEGGHAAGCPIHHQQLGRRTARQGADVA